jgi:hypothetical protein
MRKNIIALTIIFCLGVISAVAQDPRRRLAGLNE